MNVRGSVVAFAVALVAAVGCKGARRSAAAPAPESGLGPGEDSIAPLHEAQERLLRGRELVGPKARNPRAALATMRAENARRLNAINVDDGIDEDEAQTIAEMYFEMHLGDCGGPQPPTKHGGAWTSVVLFGLTGDPLATPIKVDARTGGVKGPEGPSYASFAAFRRAWSAHK